MTTKEKIEITSGYVSWNRHDKKWKPHYPMNGNGCSICNKRPTIDATGLCVPHTFPEKKGKTQ
jgi:hypothetical protein